MMCIKELTANERDTWDAFVANASFFTLLQAWDWGVFKEKLGWKAHRIAVEANGRIIAGAQILIKRLPLGLSIAYVPRGPIGMWLSDDTASLLLPELIRIARINKAIFLKIEPAVENSPKIHQLLERYQFCRSRIANQPQTTIVLNINQQQDDILMQMKKKTRQYIHRAEREGMTIRLGGCSDLPDYFNLMRLTGKREHFAARSPKYYQAEWETLSANQQGVLLMAFYKSQLIAVRSIYHFGPHAAEFHGGSLVIRGLHPNYLLVWEAIKWAQAQGCMTYDLWGIPDEIGTLFSEESEPPVIDRTDGLWGVYRFKSGFSRNIVSYIGPYDYICQPQLYALITNRFVRGETVDGIIARMDS